MSDSPKWMLIGAITILIGAIIIGNATVASMAIAVLTGIALLIGGGITVVFIAIARCRPGHTSRKEAHTSFRFYGLRVGPSPRGGPNA